MALSLETGQNVHAMSDSGLQLAVTHLNVPVGPVLTTEHLARALRSGSLAGFDQRSAAILSHLFIELDPGLIARCAHEAGADLRRANDLYKESLQAHLPRVPRWEKAVEELL
jgi:hypothetical protein